MSLPRHVHGMSPWHATWHDAIWQLSGQDSLRGIEAGLATHAQSLYHFGVKPIHGSTLSYANQHRSHELFEKTFFHMLSKCQPIAPRHKFRFKNPLYSLDATVIGLYLIDETSAKG